MQDKTALITGGNSGIGFATAKRFTDEGATVAIVGRNEETLARAAKELEPRGFGIQGDVAQLADLDRVFETASSRLGKIDALFVNAGIAAFAPLPEVDEAAFDRMVGINFKGAYFTVQKALPVLQDGASIVFNASVADQLGMPGGSVYGATKAAVRSLARTLAVELVERRIRVNVVSPGPIETPIFGRLGMQEAELDELSKYILQRVPMQRMGTPEEVANAVLFLASDDASYITATELVVDGGMSQV